MEGEDVVDAAQLRPTRVEAHLEGAHRAAAHQVEELGDAFVVVGHGGVGHRLVRHQDAGVRALAERVGLAEGTSVAELDRLAVDDPLFRGWRITAGRRRGGAW